MCGILPIQIEVGRFSKIKRELSFCRLCTKQVVEDETHFVIDCERLEGTRDEILKPLWESNPDHANMSNIGKLRWLLSKEILATLAPCIEAFFKERQSLVYNTA